MNGRWRGAGLIGALLGLWLLSGAFYIQPEGQAVLVIRFGAPVRVDTTPGLKFKLPLVDSVQTFDSRLQTLTPSAEEVILADEKRVAVQSYTVYRITDPLRFYQALHNEEQARLQLSLLVSSALRRELGTVEIHALLSDARSQVAAQVRQEVAQRAQPLGIEVSAVRMRRADLPAETSQAIYARMRSARQQEAQQLRAEGAEWAQKIQAQADRQRTEILSAAQRQSAIVRGQADAKVSLILGRAYSRAPAFYKFYRSMETTSHALAQPGTTLVLTPDTAALQALKHGPQRGRP